MPRTNTDGGKGATADDLLTDLERKLEASIALMKRCRRAMLRSRQQRRGASPRSLEIEIRDERPTSSMASRRRP
jgi:hypothetical protein